MSKYHNKKTLVDGYLFDSKKEAGRYCELKLLLAAGEIRDLVLQPRYQVAVNGKKICTYIADFRYLDVGTGVQVTEDVKSPATRKIAVYRLKKKLVEAIHGIEIVEV